MNIYLYGVLITFCWEFASFIYRIYQRFSVHDQNMAKLGLKRTLFSGSFQNETTYNIFLDSLFVTFVIAFTSLLSWPGLIFEISWVVYNHYLISREPEESKKIRQRIKEIPMDLFEMAQLDIQLTEIQFNRKLSDNEIEKLQATYRQRNIEIDIIHQVRRAG